MIVQVSPLLKRVSVDVRPQDLLLTKGAWVRFSDSWPDTHKWARGKVFGVSEEPVLVPYQASYILPGNDYKDVDLSNATAGLKLYPETEGVLYEIALGLKAGDYLVHLYVPKDRYVYALAEASMFPNVADAALKYLGAKTPNDTPFDSPLLRLFAIKDMTAFILRVYALEGVAFEKATLGFQINKCQLSEIAAPTEQQKTQALLIRYYSELTGF